MSYGLRVTKSGKDYDSTTPDDFYLHSDYPLLKVHASGTFTTAIDGSETITHNLGYKPFVMVFTQYVSTDGWGGVVLTDEYFQHDWFQPGAAVSFYGYTEVHDDKIEIDVGNTAVDPRPGEVDGFYYIFKDEV